MQQKNPRVRIERSNRLTFNNVNHKSMGNLRGPRARFPPKNSRPYQGSIARDHGHGG